MEMSSTVMVMKVTDRIASALISKKEKMKKRAHVMKS